MEGRERGYLSFLLRLWQAEGEGELVWRASLESPRTGDRWSFARLSELYAFLDEQVDLAKPGETRAEEGD